MNRGSGVNAQKIGAFWERRNRATFWGDRVCIFGASSEMGELLALGADCCAMRKNSGERSVGERICGARQIDIRKRSERTEEGNEG